MKRTAFTSGLAIIALYWTTLIIGMATCVAHRSDGAVLAIWTGTVAGSALGHALALWNVRTRFALLAIILIAILFGPSAPVEVRGSTLVLAFVPAAACAFWSLGDRTTLLAFWFPVVIWMLSILDHSSTTSIADETGIVLLGVLAALFLLYVRARESRRVALWTTVATTPLAAPQPSEVLKERPGARVARAGWALLASAIAFGATAWIAPHLWRPETLGGEQVQVASAQTESGIPCCPIIDEADTTRTRVKEYFHVGRAHEQRVVERRRHLGCRRCDDNGLVAGEAYAYGSTYSHYDGTRYDGTTYTGDVQVGGVAGGGTVVGTGGGAIATSDPWTSPSHVESTPGVADPHPVDVAPPPVTAPLPAPTQVAPPPPQAEPVVVPQTPPPAPVAAPPPVEAPSTPEHVAPSATTEPPAMAVAPPRPAPSIGPSLLHWVAVLVAGAILFQLSTLALRPIRRLVTLRHLRAPFWEGTVDQRVSNAWQLALVGLRDAGWRMSGSESPQELARRTGVDGMDKCATILDRARHGIGIDADDLSTMTSSAETAYRDARGRIGPVSRATSWLRWPLV